MPLELVAVIRRVTYYSGQSVVDLTAVDLVYPDGRDCGVPIFVEGYEGASEVLTQLGMALQKLEENRVLFEKDSEVRIPLVADEAEVKDMGFNPREL